MPKFEKFRAITLAGRAGSTAGAWAAVVVGLLILGPVPDGRAQSPRVGSPAWFNSFNAQSGVTRPATTTGSGSTSNVAPNSPSGSSVGLAQSIANFAQAARAIARAQAAQTQAARNAVPGSVPNGLTPGGLWVSPGTVAANPGIWSGAALPNAAASAARTGAVGHSGGTIVTVNQTAKTADLTRNNFNVGANTTLRFNQGGSDWTVLNRVSDPSASPSQILGAISAPGQVLVLNPNGIMFGAGSQVNVGALVASTANLALAQFAQTSGTSCAAQSLCGTVSTPGPTGAYIPSFTGATALVTVQAGASIVTNPPANAADRGGEWSDRARGRPGFCHPGRL
jgi:filamentous hemagglutinin family protein